MPSLKDFIAALQSGWFPALACIIGCTIIIAGDYYQIKYLDSVPEWIILTATLLWVFSFAILVANIAYIPVHLWKGMKRNKAKFEQSVSLINSVISAPPEERAVLAYLATTGRKAFIASLDDTKIIPLISKGLVRRDTGYHSVLEWPHIVDDTVWEYITSDKNNFYLSNAHNIPNPFSWRNIV
jgi:hypothetical protein